MTPGLTRMTARHRPQGGGFESTVCAGVARAWLDFAGAQGVDRSALLARAGLAPSALQDMDQRVPWIRFRALVLAAKALSGVPALGLRFGETMDCADYSVVAMMSRACATVGDAIVQRNRYGRLLGEFDSEPADALALQPAGPDVWLIATRQAPYTLPELTEAFFARVAAGTRQMGAQSMLKAVHFTHAEPAYRAECERVFQAPLSFDSDRNALLLDAAWLQLRIALAPSYVFGILSAHAESLLRNLDGSRTLRGRVERLLMPILHTGELGVTSIARQLGMSRQTLFRRLSLEGTNYAQVLDALRHRLALHYLDGRRVSVNETAYLVGFSDPAAFSRAFKRWTGSSPTHRASIPGSGPG